MKMKLLAVSAVIHGLLPFVQAVPAPSTHVQHEKRNDGDSFWIKHGKPDELVTLPMRVGLRQTNLNNGHDLLMDVAGHDSHNYGKWYTAEEVHDIFAPETETVERVCEWLHSAGISPERITQSTNKQWLQFDLSVKEAESLLYAEYHLFKHTNTGKVKVACDEYHVPSNVQEHIDYILPGINLGGLLQSHHGSERHPQVAKRAVQSEGFAQATPAPASVGLTPSDIRSHYSIPLATSAQPGNELGIYENSYWYIGSDLEKYFSKYAPEIPPDTRPIFKGIDGAELIIPNEFHDGEGEDSQAAYPIVYPQKIVNYQVDDLHYELMNGDSSPYQGIFNNFLDAIDGSYCTFKAYGISGNSPGVDPPYPDPHPKGYNHSLQCGVYQPTNVISFSYGENETAIPVKYQERQCLEFMKLGMQGVTVVFASGDSGAAGTYIRKGCAGPKHDIFIPYSPTNCPYVLSVGGTQFDGKQGDFDEVSWPGSGGAFSNIYGIPQYQNASVQAYLAKDLNNFKSYCSKPGTNDSYGANGGVYNRCGRATPDVSAVANNVLTILKGKIIDGGGTSAAAPIFAAVLNRINDARLAQGKSTIGFVNPTFYAHPQIFNDITRGTQISCTPEVPGFAVSEGWDPVTGLGSPNYPAMLDLFTKLP